MIVPPITLWPLQEDIVARLEDGSLVVKRRDGRGTYLRAPDALVAVDAAAPLVEVVYLPPTHVDGRALTLPGNTDTVTSGK